MYTQFSLPYLNLNIVLFQFDYKKKLQTLIKDWIHLTLTIGSGSIDSTIFQLETIYYGIVLCPVCKDKIKVHTNTKNSETMWVIAQFVGHFTKKHREYLKIGDKLTNEECTNNKKGTLFNYFQKTSTSSECVRDTTSKNSPECSRNTTLISSMIKKSRKSTANMSVIDDHQKELTSYFEYVEKIVPLITEINCPQLTEYINEIVPTSVHTETKKNARITCFIKALFEECEKGEVNKHGNRYSEYLRNVGTYLFILSGRKSYEILSANLNLPSTASVMKYLEKTPNITEAGVLSKQLKTFLLERGLPLKIFLSEDATSIVPGIKYDPKSNQLIGKYFSFDLTKNY